ncbi:hypothetical protein M419DRAFT_125397 [Trichoderma reesei RUT C-30]|uniref:Uncharacterized protein n=1 Tax=Hypocrea jecorina (strain ATCC 56765 / BCRC 32924 / NRRL 11460 / Rut C-30) TaxID=1344414 RepID=A0A024RYN0_HYPJR|nr:hypothetical protein M419DRAFT_125397 [Trichoderma reesei RUT C-30]
MLSSPPSSKIGRQYLDAESYQGKDRFILYMSSGKTTSVGKSCVFPPSSDHQPHQR